MKSIVCFASLGLVFGLISCHSAPKAPATVKADMHQLASGISTLLPLAHDPIQFNDPANREIIHQEVTRLSQFSHGFNDPAFDFVAARFSADMHEAKRQLSVGNNSASRMLIRDATNYCISCHTKTNRGTQFTIDDAHPFYKKLNALDRAQYLIAVRRFDEGVAEFERAMNSPDVALQPFPALESATLKVLAVSVRVKQDPKMSERLITRMLQSKWAPVYLQMSGLRWRTAIQEWAKAASAPRNLVEAKKLMSAAWKKQMETPLARAGLIETLRASSILQDLLDKNQKGKDYAETLYYAGLASESLHDLDLLDLSDRYFESCIRTQPHSSIARNCYIRLESTQIGRFSGSETGRLPVSLQENLETLKKLAETPGQKWNEP
jgi:hypothetical protein